MFHYLYAAVERLPRLWRPPAAGIGARPVISHRVANLVVIASQVDGPPVASPKTLALHHEVVAATMDAEALFPFRFGALVPAAELEPWVLERASLVRTTLAGLRGSVEMTVKLLRLDGWMNGTPPGGAGPGPRDLYALAERLAERAELEHWRYRVSGRPGNAAASVAFLVPRPEVPAFLSRIGPVASRAAGVAVVPTGPWPAYSFVPALDRLPLKRASTADVNADAGRRVG